MLYYTGIGSQKTPPEICQIMVQLGDQLARTGWILRSGYADGADKAFYCGASRAHGLFENYLPWRGFNNAPSCKGFIVPDMHIDPDLVFKARQMAEHFHPQWSACSQGARKLHTRNCFQVYGKRLDDPSEMVICWTPRGAGGGGTGQALRISKAIRLPIFDLAIPGKLNELHEFLDKVQHETRFREDILDERER